MVHIIIFMYECSYRNLIIFCIYTIIRLQEGTYFILKFLFGSFDDTNGSYYQVRRYPLTSYIWLLMNGNLILRYYNNNTNVVCMNASYILTYLKQISHYCQCIQCLLSFQTIIAHLRQFIQFLSGFTNNLKIITKTQ